jgi:UDP-N-acetylglucosamine 2-epimerase (non-hydrolysing)
MIKVMTIVGTRPEIIRLSEVIQKLDKVSNHILVHTGQNYDYELNELFFNELNIRKPDYFFGAGGQSLGKTIASIIEETERVIEKEKPEAVLILGDTNSSISAIMARRLKVPIYHMEAGNRSFDKNVPEETNRKLVDHISDFNLAYTEHARRHLIAEGISQRRIYVTGSPMREVLDANISKINDSNILQHLNLNAEEYFVASLHREENVDNVQRLEILLTTLNSIADKYNFPVIVSCHPRTRNRVEKLTHVKTHHNVQFLKPFGFFDYNALQKSAYCVVSDSGTIAEESAILGFPAVTPRDAIERPESLDVGCIHITGIDRDAILSGISFTHELYQNSRRNSDVIAIPAEYNIKNTSDRVVNLILGTARLSNQWDGIRKNDPHGNIL